MGGRKVSRDGGRYYLHDLEGHYHLIIYSCEHHVCYRRYRQKLIKLQFLFYYGKSMTDAHLSQRF